MSDFFKIKNKKNLKNPCAASTHDLLSSKNKEIINKVVTFKILKSKLPILKHWRQNNNTNNNNKKKW